jgi:HlyD family secretion protein
VLLQQQETILKKQLGSGEALYDKGIISEDEYDKNKTDLMLVQQNIKNSKSQIDSIDKQISDMQTQYQSGIQQRELNIKNKQTESDAFAARIKKEGELYAEVSGTVSEISVQAGQNVTINQTVVLIENTGHAGADLEAVVFVSNIQAKKIQPAHPVLIAPTATRPSEHGQITGRVLSVSPFPVTENRLITIFHNETLARQFLNAGGVFEVRVVLDKDAGTPSGFHWTGGNGPNIAVTSGNLCNATFSVEKRKPVSYLIPFLRKNLLGTDDTGIY